MRWKTFERLRREYFELGEKEQIANFFSFRNNEQVDRVFEKYRCADIAVAVFAEKHFGGGLV